MDGDYVCQLGTNTSGLSSGVSSGPTSSFVSKLRVAVAPQLVEAPQSQVFPTAKTVRFECHASGSPTPTIKWLKVISIILIHY